MHLGLKFKEDINVCRWIVSQVFVRSTDINSVKRHTYDKKNLLFLQVRMRSGWQANRVKRPHKEKEKERKLNKIKKNDLDL